MDVNAEFHSILIAKDFCADSKIMTRDYFAEMYVAGIMADKGWNIYFPRRDKGFDFIITKTMPTGILVRPVQVKGKFPSEAKTDKSCYGYRGTLSQLHPEMVLVLAYFPTDENGVAPAHIAYMPRSAIRNGSRDGYRCRPAAFSGGKPEPRRDFAKFFGADGLAAVELQDWGQVTAVTD